MKGLVSLVFLFTSIASTSLAFGDCLSRALSPYELGLNSAQATSLCLGATDQDAPIECAKQALSPYNLGLMIDDAIILCARATHAQVRIDCTTSAMSNLGIALPPPQAALLCSSAQEDSKAPIACWQNAFDRGLQADQAVHFCVSPI